MARIDKHDAGVCVLDERQRPIVWQPGRFVKLGARGFPEQLGRADLDCIRTAIGIRPDRPPEQTPPARADQMLAVGMKQHSLAETALEMGQLADHVDIPEVHAIRAAGRQYSAIRAHIRRLHLACDRVLGLIADHAGMQNPALGSHSDVPNSDRPTDIEGQTAVVLRERALECTGAIARASPETPSQSRVVPSKLDVASK